MRTRTRLMALPLLAGLAFSLVPPTASADQSDAARASSAISWLSDNSGDSGMLESYPGTGDPGLTLDAVIAAVAAGAPSAIIADWLEAVEPVFKERAIYDAGQGLTRHTGLIAKALFALTAAGDDPATYAGLDLRELTEDSLNHGAEPGWAGAPFGRDSVNAFGQAFVMLGLAATGDLPSSTVAFVSSKQCTDGGFPLYFTAGQSCAQAGSKSDPDGTALLIMALRAAQADGIGSSQAPLTKAVDWLAGMQRPNGSYYGAVPFTAVENTNSSGLAAAALAGLKPTHVARVGDWVAGLQLSSGPDAGAIAYSQADFDGHDATTPLGISRGTWLRATTQGLSAFVPRSFHDLLASEPEPEDDFVRTAPYTLPGEHIVNGRRWLTTCEPYSQTERCRTNIWASVVELRSGKYQVVQGWAFNNLTYLPSARSLWVNNPLGYKNLEGWTGDDGRRWKTDCDSAATGSNGCRSYAEVTVVSATPRPAGGYTFSKSNTFVFNNIVLFRTR
ncbi:hypothetical protein [Tessaracoccus flavus]|nr:hypothetical protein [Tessaracoccus flavus]